MQQLITRIRRWWTEKPRSTRILTYVLIPAGVVLLVEGLRLDSSNWWAGHDYFLNIYSAATGVCFGVPAALLLFNKLASDQDAARRARLAMARAGAEATQFQRELLSLFSAADLADLTARATDLRDQITGIRDLPSSASSRDQDMGRFLADFDTLLPSPLGRPRRSLRSLPAHYSAEWAPMDDWRTRVQSRWNILYNEVRPNLPGNGWIAADSDTAAQQALDRLLLPGRNPWKADQSDGAAVRAMQYFLRDVTALCGAATALDTYT
ncbi:hypothetical protein [Streptomyces regalis]|uniref:Uncharacterized protein n=1 Tax=Streptomyces regalis TaxID=68262 RepID=A0A0X3V636_9ACTN|nr:hypothetical protein [Streptomyces regalis]KUL39907.1 hypothetical protein ADL12_14355 [Streptomyces regalis]